MTERAYLYPMNITDYTAERKIRLSVIATEGLNRDAQGWEHFAFRVQLRLNGRTITTPWKQGTGIGSQPPKADEVLNGLLIDASFGDYDFAEFCAESGIETETFADAPWDDDAKRAKADAEKTYKACARMAKRLPEFLGSDAEYERAQECERL